MLTAAIRGYRRLSRALPTLTDHINRGLGALCTDALNENEKNRLTALCYGSSYHLNDAHLAPLFPWEESWFAAALPPAPASILIPAAGAGREVVALRARGYIPFGFDPAVRESPNQHGVVRGCFDALLSNHRGRLKLEGAPNDTVDAVIFGWGSLSHLYSEASRIAVLRAAVECCPTGPILLSYWATADRTERSAWIPLLEGLGAGIGRLRTLPKTNSLPCEFNPNAGLATYLEREDLERYAAQLGRLPHFGGTAYAHVTFTPPAEHRTPKACT